MELELEQDVVVCYELVGQVSACQEETQEAIVPDACPDILRLADVNAQAFVSRWEVKEGQAAVIGFVQTAVLYIPESGHGIRKMDVKIPFTVYFELGSLSSDCILEATARLRCSDGRLLNPRKILLRADLTAEIKAFRRREYPVCTGAYQADNVKICQRLTRVDHERVVCVPQRIFPMSEEIRLTGAQAPEVLACRGECICTESRVIGSKLIFKGKTEVILLLQTESGVERRIETFPFSQILEAKEAGEHGIGQVHLELAELFCRSASDDPFRLILDMEVLAQGLVRDRENVSLLTDLYSTANQTQITYQPLKLFSPGEQQILPQSFRDMLETGDVVRSVCDSRFALGSVRYSADPGGGMCVAQGQITVLYLDEDRQLRQLKKDIELSIRTGFQEGDRVQCRCQCPGDLYAAPCAGGIEVRLNLEFHIWADKPLQLELVTGASLGELRESTGVRPSVILRRAEPGEDLWDIAKTCGTTKQSIMQANEMSSEEIPGGKMLLIPSVR